MRSNTSESRRRGACGSVVQQTAQVGELERAGSKRDELGCRPDCEAKAALQLSQSLTGVIRGPRHSGMTDAGNEGDRAHDPPDRSPDMNDASAITRLLSFRIALHWLWAADYHQYVRLQRAKGFEIRILGSPSLTAALFGPDLHGITRHLLQLTTRAGRPQGSPTDPSSESRW